MSALRVEFPRVKSLLMGTQAIGRYRKIAGAGTGSNDPTPANLTSDEAAAFDICRLENLRVEQERIPLTDVELSGP